jgi:hypothetical protein
MKKTKAGVGRSAGKGARASARGKRITGQGKKISASGKSAAKNLDEYIARVPEGARSRLREMRAAIRSAVPAGAVQVEESAGVVRGVFGALQLVPYRVGDRRI